MTNLIQRLRAFDFLYCREAADEIERLRNEITSLTNEAVELTERLESLESILAGVLDGTHVIVPFAVSDAMIEAWLENGRSPGMPTTTYRCPQFEARPRCERDWHAMIEASQEKPK